MNPNSHWRPETTIRVKAIGIAKHENRLLVCEVLNDDGLLKGWCPLGGGIEFGETAEAALRREFLEELGCSLEIRGSPLVCENIFEHHGIQGHEIIFAFPIVLNDREVYEKNRFLICEQQGNTHWAEWISLKSFENGQNVLFPLALKKSLSSL
jgi:ADP-ribose pyrophosphatase YjhB (NUDIX family)